MNTLLLFQKLPRIFRRHKLLRLFARFGGGGVVQRVRVNSTFDAFIDIRDGFARLVAIENGFETDFFALAKVLLNKPSPVFFDVGANYGLMSFGLCGILGDGFQAHLFEANSYLCGIIEKSAALNGGGRFRVVNAAVMDTDEDVCLSFDIAHTGAGYVSKDMTGERLRAITLDDYIETHGIERIHLLKIDVEGNEALVLKGAERSLQNGVIDAVYFEYCLEHQQRANTSDDPIEILDRFGFDVFRINVDGVAECTDATHYIGSAESRVLLTEVHAPLDTGITDLIATRRGAATKGFEK